MRTHRVPLFLWVALMTIACTDSLSKNLLFEGI